MEHEINFGRYAIFQTGGKQYQGIEGKTVSIEKLNALPGAKVVFDEVLLRRVDDKTVEVGQPFLTKPIKAEVLKHDKGPKLISFMFKRRKKIRRKIGHRQPCTIVRILEI
jgi:large subunit ribosomal protein L21